MMRGRLARSHRFLAVVLAATFAGCTSGGRTAPSAPTVSTTANAVFTLTIPNRVATSTARATQFVSPSTLSGTITVNGGATTELNLGSSACTTVTGGRACTFSVAAPIGADTFALALYDGAFTAGAHAGTQIGAASNFAVTVSEGKANVSTPLVVGGIPKFADVFAQGLMAGVAGTVPLTVTVYDSDGNVIVGPAAYVNAAGAAAAVTVSMRTVTSQATLHNGAQNGSSITVASPADTPTIQLIAPAKILGVLLKVTDASSTVLATKNTTDSIAVNGTLTTTQLAANYVSFPDYLYLAQSDSSLVPGVPDGIAWSIGTQSSGVAVGFFSASSETMSYCNYNTNNNLGVAAAPSGIAFGFNGAFNVDTTPTGIAYVPLTGLTGGTCSPNSYTHNFSFAKTLVWDAVTNALFEVDTNGAYASDSYAAGAFSAHTVLGTYGTPKSMTAVNGVKYVVFGGNAVYTGTGSSALVAHSTGSTETFTAIAARPDGSVYALDSLASQRVERYDNATGTFTTPYASLSGGAGAGSLTIGPDGNAYTVSGSVQSTAPNGTIQNAALAPPNGYAGTPSGVFDGHNGYLYVWYDDGFNQGTEFVFRVSY
jgi:hypothetical protein